MEYHGISYNTVFLVKTTYLCLLTQLMFGGCINLCAQTNIRYNSATEGWTWSQIRITGPDIYLLHT